MRSSLTPFTVVPVANTLVYFVTSSAVLSVKSESTTVPVELWILPSLM
jgi:hypothetical protein